jgi:tetratricopeptide (TPR) repeat protein
VFMQRIRRATKKHRKVLLAAVIILTIGLVGSFAVWNSDNYSNNDSTEMTTAEQIGLYEDYLAENEPAADAAVDYDTAASMAEIYMSLRSLCYQAYTEVAATDADAGLQYYTQSVEAAVKAAEYYQLQLDAAPEALNDFGKAQIIAAKAQALAFAGSNDEAQTLYDQALALSPDNYDVASKYLDFVYINQGIAAARTYADSYKALVGESSDYYSQMEEVIGYYELLDQLQETSTEVQQESDAADSSDTQ